MIGTSREAEDVTQEGVSARPAVFSALFFQGAMARPGADDGAPQRLGWLQSNRRHDDASSSMKNFAQRRRFRRPTIPGPVALTSPEGRRLSRRSAGDLRPCSAVFREALVMRELEGAPIQGNGPRDRRVPIGTVGDCLRISARRQHCKIALFHPGGAAERGPKHELPASPETPLLTSVSRRRSSTRRTRAGPTSIWADCPGCFSTRALSSLRKPFARRAAATCAPRGFARLDAPPHTAQRTRREQEGRHPGTWVQLRGLAAPRPHRRLGDPSSRPARADRGSLVADLTSSHIRALLAAAPDRPVASNPIQHREAVFDGKLDFAPPVRDLGNPVSHCSVALEVIDGHPAERSSMGGRSTLNLFIWPANNRRSRTAFGSRNDTATTSRSGRTAKI